MSQKHKSILLPLVIVLVTAIGTLGFVINRPSSFSERLKSKTIAVPATRRGSLPTKANEASARNLSLQPEAFNLSRRLGQRVDARWHADDWF